MVVVETKTTHGRMCGCISNAIEMHGFVHFIGYWLHFLAQILGPRLNIALRLIPSPLHNSQFQHPGRQIRWPRAFKINEIGAADLVVPALLALPQAAFADQELQQLAQPDIGAVTLRQACQPVLAARRQTDYRLSASAFRSISLIFALCSGLSGSACTGAGRRAAILAASGEHSITNDMPSFVISK